MRLLERDGYIEQLGAVLRGSRSGTGRIALVAGEAGIGKTSLLRQFASIAAQNPPGVPAIDTAPRFLWGGCEALFTPHPLAPLQDIARQIGGDFAHSIAAAPSRHEIFNATLDRLSQLPAPTVLIIEDAHWADEATLDLIKFLGRRLHRLAILLVVSYREDEVDDKHPLRQVIGDLPAGSVSRIELPRLSPAAVGLLAKEAGQSSAGLHEVTGGNPFFVTEVLAAGDGKVPSTVRDAVIARIARLSEAARRVAHFVSIVPGKAERWLIDRAIAPAGDVVQQCLHAGMVIHSDYALGFRHELARRAVEDSMLLPERRELHARALAALLEERAGEEKSAMSRLVHHADHAGDTAAVLRFAPLAAERAAAMGAHREASHHLATALRHGAALGVEEKAQLLERLSYECYLTDQIADAVKAREAALGLWRALGSALKEGDSLRWLSRLGWFSGQKEAAVRYAIAAVRALETLPQGRELAMAYSNCSQLYMLADETKAAVEWGGKALTLAAALGDAEIQSHALNNIGTAKLVGQDAAGRDDLERSLQIALEGKLEEHAARAFTNLASTFIRHRDFAGAAQYLKAGIAYCEEHDLDSWARYMAAHRAETSLALGHWDHALADAAAIIRHPRVAPVTKIPALTVLGLVRLRRGEGDVEAPLGEALRLAVPTQELQRLGPAFAARAEATWLHGTASADFLEQLAAAYELGTQQSDPWIRGELAFWLWRHGRLDKAPRGIARPFALHIAGDWRAAAGAWEKLGCPYEQAMALADSDEEGSLRAALELLKRLDAAPMMAILRRKLRARGVRGIPRGAQQRTRQNPFGMTRRELEVLTLLMGGRRNADIARRLFVSEKTIDHHVSAVLGKLGVHSRVEAAAAAAKLGLREAQLERRVAQG